ncbi:hypothetical protein B566_EDAN001558 [Ephemera danica]|nr:hypothetical protein B566_EDAN001558 [Ephemera danica]
MARKFLVLATLVVVAYATVPLENSATLTKEPVKVDLEFDPHPQYAYSYSVADPATGDHKSQTESRNGDTVRGSYSLVEPDGTRRIVEYSADPVNGFNAVVHKQAVTKVTKLVKVAAPVHYAPAVTVATPVAYHG